MSYIRCMCHNGDVPHEGATVHTPRLHGRCTRAATVWIRKVGKRGWYYRYCPRCAEAILTYQGAWVERRPE
jgi:hypothetical protein